MFCLKLCIHLKVFFNAYFRECSQIMCLLENNFRNFSFQIKKLIQSFWILRILFTGLCLFYAVSFIPISSSHVTLAIASFQIYFSKYKIVLNQMNHCVAIDSHIETNLENFRSQSIFSIHFSTQCPENNLRLFYSQIDKSRTSIKSRTYINWIRATTKS